MPDYTKSFEEELLLDGRKFTEEVDDNVTSLDILLQNPTDSEVNLVTFTASLTHANDVTVTVYDQVSNISGGTPQDAENDFVGHPRTERGNCVRDPTFSGDNDHSIISYLGSGTRDLFQGSSLAIMPGEEILVMIQDDTGSAKQMSLLLTWGEIPLKEADGANRWY